MPVLGTPEPTRRCVIHCGPHKTGTTALQSAFAANEALLSRHDLHYPMSGRRSLQHTGLAEACAGNDTRLLRDLTAEIEAEDGVFLSSETFATLDETALIRLRDALPGFRFEIVYVLRRLPELWRSQWAQNVKHAMTPSFEEYLARRDADPDRYFRTPPYPSLKLELLERVFGAAALKLPIFDARPRGPDMGPSFARDVLAFSPPEGALRTAKENRTPDADWIELLRHVQIALRRQAPVDDVYEVTRRFLASMSRKRPDWYPEFASLLACVPPVTLDQDHPFVAQECAHLMSRFAQAMIDPFDPFLAPCSVQIRCIDPDDMPLTLRRRIEAFSLSLFATA